jgi:hypothetical protein
MFLLYAALFPSVAVTVNPKGPGPFVMVPEMVPSAESVNPFGRPPERVQVYVPVPPLAERLVE